MTALEIPAEPLWIRPGEPVRAGELCAGYGGLALSVNAAFGATTAWYSEIDPGACKVLAARFPAAPNLGDMTLVDWRLAPRVHVLAGGTPCQDISQAGRRAGMTEGTRSNLWVAMRDAIKYLRPHYVVWENVRGALSARAASESDLEPGAGFMGDGGSGPNLRALGRVLGDLTDLGYDAEWRTIRASEAGAPHRRERVFVIAYAANDTSHSQ